MAHSICRLSLSGLCKPCNTKTCMSFLLLISFLIINIRFGFSLFILGNPWISPYIVLVNYGLYSILVRTGSITWHHDSFCRTSYIPYCLWVCLQSIIVAIYYPVHQFSTHFVPVSLPSPVVQHSFTAHILFVHAANNRTEYSFHTARRCFKAMVTTCFMFSHHCTYNSLFYQLVYTAVTLHRQTNGHRCGAFPKPKNSEVKLQF